jgi:hypothetical protein
LVGAAAKDPLSDQLHHVELVAARALGLCVIDRQDEVHRYRMRTIAWESDRRQIHETAFALVDEREGVREIKSHLPAATTDPVLGQHVATRIPNVNA